MTKNKVNEFIEKNKYVPETGFLLNLGEFKSYYEIYKEYPEYIRLKKKMNYQINKRMKKSIDIFIKKYGYFPPLRLIDPVGLYPKNQSTMRRFYKTYPKYKELKECLTSDNNSVLKEFCIIYEKRFLKLCDIKASFPIEYNILIHFYKNTKTKGGILANFEDEYNISHGLNYHVRVEEQIKSMATDNCIILKSPIHKDEPTAKLRYYAYKSVDKKWMNMNELIELVESYDYKAEIRTL